MPKAKKVTKTEQRVAATILTAFMFVRDMDELSKVWDDLYEKYELYDDPFTDTPCTPEEYAKNSLEFMKQTMEELYGHCDWLE